MSLLRKAIKTKFNLVIIVANVKRSFGDYIVKLLRKSGFYVEKITSVASLHSKLTKGGTALKEDELRKTTNFLRRTNDLNLYDQILRQFVPTMDMHFSDAKFMGAGMGATTLNVYRKVTFGDVVLFEKVYFNSSLDIERVKWFYDNIYTSIKDTINAPPLYSVFRGELITLFYFQFVELLPVVTKDIEGIIFSFSTQLYNLSQTVDIKRKIENAPAFLKDYKAHFEYKRKIEKAGEKAFELLGESFPLKNIEKIISESPLTLTHGDIHPGNVFQNKYLIDWDPFGLYPIGLEVAYILLFLYKDKVSYKELIEILDKIYRSIILEEHWDDFELNCLYFYYVFTTQTNAGIALNDAQCDILKRIEVLYYKKVNSMK